MSKRKTNYSKVIILLAIIASVPFARFDVINIAIDLSIADIATIIGFFFIVTNLTNKRSKLKPENIEIVFVLLFTFFLASTYVTLIVNSASEVNTGYIRTIVTFIGGGLIALTFSLLITNKEDLLRAMMFYFFMSVLLAAFNILTSLEVLEPIFEYKKTPARLLFDKRLPFVGTAVVFGGRGTYGIWMLFAMSIGMAWLSLIRIRKIKLLWYLGIATIITGIIVTQSRSTWLGTFCLITAFLTWKTIKNRDDALKIAIISSFGLFVAVSFLFSGNVLIVLIEKIYKMNIGSAEARVLGYKVGLNIIENNIIWGQLTANQISIEKCGSVIHNTFIYIGASFGLIGLLVILISTGYPVIKIFYFRQKHKKLFKKNELLGFFSNAVLFGIIGVGIEMNFYQGFNEKAFWLYMGYVLATAKIIKREAERKSKISTDSARAFSLKDNKLGALRKGKTFE